MVDEVDRQIQIKARLDEQREDEEHKEDLDHGTPKLRKKAPPGAEPTTPAPKTSKSPVAEKKVRVPNQELKRKLDQIRKEEEEKTMKGKIAHAKRVAEEAAADKPEMLRKIHRYEAGLAGAASGSIARIATQPLDVLKIRFQLQVEDISGTDPRSKYKGLLQATKQIVKEENMLALWKGHSPAQFLSTSYGMLQWLTYEELTKHAWSYSPILRSEKVEPFVHFVSGGIAGVMGTLGSSPFDVIRTRLVGQGTPPMYRGTWHAAYTMWKEEGFRTFYKGIVPAMLQIAPYSGLQFMAYAMLTKQWKKKRGAEKKDESSGWLGSLFCGMIAGLVAKTAIYPLDVAKKRLQIQGFDTARKQFGRTVKYTGLINCFKVMIKEEGPYSLYKGLLPSSLKAASNTGLNFMFYEKILHLLRYAESEDFWFK